METLTIASIDNHQLILSLIKDDLINSKLVNNLIGIGIDASIYSLNLRTAILKLMGFDSVNDEIHEQYSDFTLRSKDIDFAKEPQLLNPLVMEVYDFLDGLDRKAVRIELPFIFNRTIAIDLIKQDLINYRMIDLFHEIGIDAEFYMLDLGRIIFEIMAVEHRKDSGEIYEDYVKLLKKMEELHPTQKDEEVNTLATEMYDYLEKCSQKAE